MRHGKRFNHLGRKAGHRRATLRNLALALIEHKRINTTLAKAKALRRYIEPLITKAKTNTTHSRRVVFSYLQNKEGIKELFGPIAEKVGDRPGGYVRVIRTGFRQSDGAELAMIELVDFNEVYTAGEDAKGKSGRRRRRRRGGGGGSQAAAATTETATETSTSEEAETDLNEEAEEAAEEVVENAAETAAASEEAAEEVEEVESEEPAAEEAPETEESEEEDEKKEKE